MVSATGVSKDIANSGAPDSCLPARPRADANQHPGNTLGDFGEAETATLRDAGSAMRPAPAPGAHATVACGAAAKTQSITKCFRAGIGATREYRSVCADMETSGGSLPTCVEGRSRPVEFTPSSTCKTTKEFSRTICARVVVMARVREARARGLTREHHPKKVAIKPTAR